MEKMHVWILGANAEIKKPVEKTSPAITTAVLHPNLSAIVLDIGPEKRQSSRLE